MIEVTYHTDNFDSTFMVTDVNSAITQAISYIPYGEVFVEQQPGGWSSPYLFNAKELDSETGLYYYGARYLDPSDAMWLSVDPLWEKYVGMTPYNYCAGNPVVMVDPDGKSGVKSEQEDGSIIIETNIVICVEKEKSISPNLTEKQKEKIERKNQRIRNRNQERINEIKKDLNAHYIRDDIKNSEGKTVKFNLNYYIYETENPDLNSEKERNKVLNQYKIISSEIKFNDSNTGEKVYKNVSPAIFTTRKIYGDESCLGKTDNGLFIYDNKSVAPYGTYSHELIHTFLVGDNGYNKGGLLNNPPALLPLPTEIDEILNNCPVK